MTERGWQIPETCCMEEVPVIRWNQSVPENCFLAAVRYNALWEIGAEREA